MATAREPIEQAGYISATSDIQQKSFLRNAAGPYIRVNFCPSSPAARTSAVGDKADQIAGKGDKPISMSGLGSKRTSQLTTLRVRV